MDNGRFLGASARDLVQTEREQLSLVMEHKRGCLLLFILSPCLYKGNYGVRVPLQ